MFGTNKNPNTSKGKMQSQSAINSLVHGTSITGDVTSDNDIRIDGTLTGNIDCKGKVIIGTEGRVEGTITCQDCVVEGTYSGELTVADTLSIYPEARLDGHVTTKRLSIQQGAIFNVVCVMGEQKFGTITPLNKSEKIS